MNKCIAEQSVTNRKFLYPRPWFYNHPYALRCELGIGDTNEAYWASARARATELYGILFPMGADMVFFDHWKNEYCGSGAPEWMDWESMEEAEEINENRIEAVTRDLRFLLRMQMRYRHATLYDLPWEDQEEDGCRRNRVICWSDGTGFDFEALLEQNLQEEYSPVSFVSFENACIFSVYDSRGCDIVFLTPEKMREFYTRLEPYFLDYDREEMERRFREA